MKLFLICLGTTLCIFGSCWQLCGQTTADPTATVQFSDGHSISVTDFSSSVAIQPDELLKVTLQFPADAVGDTVVVEAPDGGSVSLGSNVIVVGESGSVSFAFRAPADAGQKSISVRSTSTSFSLQFSVGSTQG